MDEIEEKQFWYERDAKLREQNLRQCKALSFLVASGLVLFLWLLFHFLGSWGWIGIWLVTWCFLYWSFTFRFIIDPENRETARKAICSEIDKLDQRIERLNADRVG